jgi:hypothetical protein
LSIADIIPGGSPAITPGSDIFRLGSLGLATVCLALLTGGSIFRAQTPSAVPCVTFTKTLKGSTPEYLSLSIDANGKGTYDSHKLGEPAAPRPLQISAETTAQIFSLTQSLDYFRSLNLDSHHKVADMGLKILTYLDSRGTNEVQFNYSENHSAQQLTDIFEKISNVEERIAQLDYAMKYDHLNLPQVLRQVEYGMENSYFVEAALMIPTLDKIAADPHYLHLAQSRAREIEQRIQKNK